MYVNPWDLRESDMAPFVQDRQAGPPADPRPLYALRSQNLDVPAMVRLLPLIEWEFYLTLLQPEIVRHPERAGTPPKVDKGGLPVVRCLVPVARKGLTFDS